MPFKNSGNIFTMKPSMLAKLDQLTERLAELNLLLTQENATSNMDNYRKLTREHAELGPLVALYQHFTQAGSDILSAQEMLSDPEMKEFAQEEIAGCKGADGTTRNRSAKNAAAERPKR
jgi:peptide chain release factor 1